MKNYYSMALRTPIEFGDFEKTVEDRNAGLSMMIRGLGRGQNQSALYKSGVTGHSARKEMEIMVGAVNIGEHGIMKGITGFIIDLAHILLMCGGIYLLLASFGWVR